MAARVSRSRAASDSNRLFEHSTGAYASALDIAQTLEETKQTGSAAKIRQRVEFLERAALAHLTAAEIAVNRVS